MRDFISVFMQVFMQWFRYIFIVLVGVSWQLTAAEYAAGVANVANIIMAGNTQGKAGSTGRLKDEDLQLIFIQPRFYGPMIGRFYSNDPVGFTASNPMMFNRYAYAHNNPYKYIDPDGQNPRRPKFHKEVNRDNEVAEILGESLVDILPDGAVKKHIQNNVDTLKVINASNRRKALKEAQKHAQVPRISRGGVDIPLNELRPSSRGANYEKIKKAGATNIGRRDPNSKAEVMDHPDGHDDNNATHHNSPHVHAVDRKGIEVIIKYPEKN